MAYYSHLVKIEPLLLKLEEVKLEENHKKDLANLIDATIYQVVLDWSLGNLPEIERRDFLVLIAKNRHPEAITFLSDRIDNVEAEISRLIQETIEEFLIDIEEVKRLKNE